MASLVQRGNRYCVVYQYTNENGERKQKWETYKTASEAKRRKKEIEYKEEIGTFTVPKCKSLDDLLKEYVALYGKATWAMSTYSSNVGLIDHYISPIIGHMKLNEITTRVIEKYYQRAGNRLTLSIVISDIAGATHVHAVAGGAWQTI